MSVAAMLSGCAKTSRIQLLNRVVHLAGARVRVEFASSISPSSRYWATLSSAMRRSSSNSTDARFA
jgi:hypothetical protein